MVVRKWWVEHRPRDQLLAKRRLSPIEQAELDQLEMRLTGRWKRLPDHIRDLRTRLSDAESYAAEIGLGPV